MESCSGAGLGINEKLTVVSLDNLFADGQPHTERRLNLTHAQTELGVLVSCCASVHSLSTFPERYRNMSAIQVPSQVEEHGSVESQTEFHENIY